MTDPIEKAADAIIELINSQPRSPLKSEIMDVLRLHHPHRPEGYQVSGEALSAGADFDSAAWVWQSMAGPGSVTTPYVPTTNYPIRLLDTGTDYTSWDMSGTGSCDLPEASLEALIADLASYRDGTSWAEGLATALKASIEELQREANPLPSVSGQSEFQYFGPDLCCHHHDGKHRMGPGGYSVNEDAYVSGCYCGHRVVLQK